MLGKLLVKIVGPTIKNHLRAFYHRRKHDFVCTFLSYGSDELAKALLRLGVQKGDTILLHSAFETSSGFTGSPEDVIDVFLDAVGTGGNLLMVSLAYLSSSYDYLKNLKCFDVRKTISRMGLISESFRRRKDVLRSLHPTHPVLACGPQAEWIVRNHEQCLAPCGAGTPFEKLALLNGKVFFFDTPFASFTFFHYLEDLVKDKLPFPLYCAEPFAVEVVDHEGRRSVVKTLVFSPSAIQRRRFGILETEFWNKGLIKTARIGNSKILSIEVQSAIACALKMFDRGRYFYDVTEPVS